MRFVFTLLLSIHGLIHLLGFIKAYEFSNISQLSQSISKPIGLLWLITCVLFLSSGIFYLQRKHWWFFMALLAIILSQILITMAWKDAKFGTITNVIILLVSLSAYGTYEFNKKVAKETATLLNGVIHENDSIITENDITHLPKIVQKWLQKSGIIGKEKLVSVWLKQQGKMKTNPDGKWLPFVAKQYFNLSHPGFVWTTQVDFLPLVKMIGRDIFVNGEGEMLIKLAGLIPVVNKHHNDKINQASMIRFLSETVWFPSAALHSYITWETIDATSAMATFTIHNTYVNGVFRFSPEGNFVSFEAQRYYEANQDSSVETWLVQAESYAEFEGVTIPNECRVTWKLKEGDFNWLVLEISDLKYNVKQL